MTESILQEAQRLIHGDRNKNYGHPRENFQDIADLFSAYLGQEITDIDVANLMILVKVARVKETGYHRDSFTDIAGYAGCVERIYEEPEPKRDLNFSINIEPRRAPTIEEWERLYPYPHPAEQPREWKSLDLVPHDVEVRSQGGEFWSWHEDQGWLWTSKGQKYTPGLFKVGPFTEILEGK